MMTITTKSRQLTRNTWLTTNIKVLAPLRSQSTESGTSPLVSTIWTRQAMDTRRIAQRFKEHPPRAVEGAGVSCLWPVFEATTWPSNWAFPNFLRQFFQEGVAFSATACWNTIIILLKLNSQVFFFCCRGYSALEVRWASRFVMLPWAALLNIRHWLPLRARLGKKRSQISARKPFLNLIWQTWLLWIFWKIHWLPAIISDFPQLR